MGGELLTLELERALLHELLSVWRSYNWQYFGEALRTPGFELADGASWLGRWNGATRTLAVSRGLVLEHPWWAVEEVLKHEMAHQYAEEVLGAVHETAHGPAFRRVCSMMGIDAAATGLPEEPPPTAAEARVVERISRLLSLAGSPNQHEAEAATLAARRLMLRHNLDARATPKRYHFKQLGRPSGRIEESARILGRILLDHFFVEVIWVPAYRPLSGKRGSVMEVLGTPTNLAIAEYVHAYLSHAADELWRAHQRKLQTKRNRDRRTFQAGVMDGFREKLVAERPTQEEARALVWLKDADLEGFFRRRHPRVHQIARSGQARDASFFHGREAGKRIVLRKGLSTEVVARGRLLGSGG